MLSISVLRERNWPGFFKGPVCHVQVSSMEGWRLGLVKKWCGLGGRGWDDVEGTGAGKNLPETLEEA